MADTLQNCPHCGKKLTRPEAAFCTHCGGPLKTKDGAAIMPTVHGGTLAKIIVHLPQEETREEFLSKMVTTVGRRQGNMIQVLSPIVSGEHARIELTRQGHTITDLESTNGTYVNGKRLRPQQAHRLENNDIIRFSDGLGNSASLTYIAPAKFTGVDQIDHDRVFNLDQPISFIGRNPEAAIALSHPAVSWNHARVIRRDESHYAVQDLSSNNGTFLNGVQLRRERLLEQGDVLQIGPFNLVYRGQGAFAPYSAERNFRLEAVNLEKVVYPSTLFGLKNRKKPIKILKNINLVINPREFIALVGGSGTGKSTLLKALGGISPATAGLVLVNGDPLYDNFNLYRNLVGYVPQDDIIHQNIQVRQALYYAAQLRLPDAGPEEIGQRVDEVLEKVGLTWQAGTLVRDLSGGQRKRVSIAAELLAEPWIFFLDEPTSGLDPGLEKVMMDTLRQLADEGRTIVLVTHATSNIHATCDQVAFMIAGGELAYFGPPAQALNFFEVADFPDIYTRLSQNLSQIPPQAWPKPIQALAQESGGADSGAGSGAGSGADSGAREGPASPLHSGQLWAKLYHQSPLYRTYIENRQAGAVARPISEAPAQARGQLKQHFKQFAILSRRYLDLIRHDKISLWVLLAVMPLIGLFLLMIGDRAALVGHTPAEIGAILAGRSSYTIVNQAQTLLFMMALAANLLGVFAAAYEIIREEVIYHRERTITLRIAPYFAAKFAVLALFLGLQCLLLLLVLAFKIDFPEQGAMVWGPLEYYFTLVFTALASIGLGLFISALATSQNTVIYLVLLVLFIQIVFSGAIFELSPAAQPFSYLTITRWSLEALGASTDMAGLNSLGQVRVEREINFGRGRQMVVEEVPTTIDFQVNYTHNGLALISRWIFLLVHSLVWSSLTLWLLKRKDDFNK
jgi:ABC-type multidrug transport system ATPase subunit/pSer/pThr/pTyr-binding forkhead associated (FHA) protein